MRSVKSILVVTVSVALLTAYIFLNATTDTFLIYLGALIFWVGLSRYCGGRRDLRPEKTDAPLDSLSR